MDINDLISEANAILDGGFNEDDIFDFSNKDDIFKFLEKIAYLDDITDDSIVANDRRWRYVKNELSSIQNSNMSGLHNYRFKHIPERGNTIDIAIDKCIEKKPWTIGE